MDNKPLPVLIYHPRILGYEIVEYVLRQANIPCVSAHTLDDRAIAAAGEGNDQERKKLSNKLNVIRRTIELSKGNQRWKVITFVREPISEADGIANWFDSELKKTFSFDVYSIPYDRSRDFQIYQTEHADILLFKLERFSQCYQQVFSYFLNRPVPQLQFNADPYRKIYNNIKHSMKLSVPEIKRLHSSKGVRHFYSHDEISGFMRDWIQKMQLTEPWPIAISPDGQIYLADNGIINRYASSGDKIEEIEIEDQPLSMAVADNGRIYMGVKDHVQIYEEGKQIAKWPSLGENAMLSNIVIDGQDVFVADAGNKVIIRYDENGNQIDRVFEDVQGRNKNGCQGLSPYYALTVNSEKKPKLVIHEIPKPYKRIYQYHIHKSGGTSLNHVFFSLGGDLGGKVYMGLNRSSSGAGISNGILFTNWKRSSIEQGDYYYAHSHAPMHSMNVPPDTFTFTILREPIKRLISHYRHLKEIVTEFPGCAEMKTEGRWLGNSFSDFIRNIPKTQLLHQTHFFSRNYDVDEAVENIAKCSFFFFTEEFKDGFAELSQRLGIKLSYNHTRKSTLDIEIKETDREYLRGLLQKEYELIGKLKRHPSYWRANRLSSQPCIMKASKDDLILPVGI